MLRTSVAVMAIAAGLAVSHAHDAGAATYAAQKTDEHGIKVTVTPQTLSKGAKTWTFEVVLETHTQPLDDDVAKSSVLVAEGQRYPSLGWQGSPPGGHHRKGILQFEAVTPRPQSIAIQIRLTGDQSPRNFSWPLKED